MAEEQHFLPVFLADRLASPAHYAGSRAREAGQRAQERGLAAAVGAARAQQASRRDREREIAEQGLPSALGGERRGLKHANDFTCETAGTAAAKRSNVGPCRTAGWFLSSTSGTCSITWQCSSSRPRSSRSGASGTSPIPNCCRSPSAASSLSAPLPFRRAGSQTTG